MNSKITKDGEDVPGVRGKSDRIENAVVVEGQSPENWSRFGNPVKSPRNSTPTVSADIKSVSFRT